MRAERNRRLLYGLLLTSALAGSAAPVSAERCQYLDVYVEPGGMAGSADLEGLRSAYLDLYRGAAERSGLRIVVDRSQAWLELSVGAAWSGPQLARLDFHLSPMLRLEHHFFVALTADPAFPFSGQLGTVHQEDVPTRAPPRELSWIADYALRVVWENEARQIRALCAIAEELVDEGWTSLDELQQELVAEIERARRNRSEATRRKRLSIGVDGDARP